MKFKDRIKSYSFWTALSAGVVVFAQAIAKCFGLQIQEELISDIIMSICGLLIVFGVVTMPKKNDTTEEKNNGEENNLNNDNEDVEDISEQNEKK